MTQAVMHDGTLMLVCEWFAKCTNPTLKAAPHPILTRVPCCDRCARLAHIPAKDLVEIELRTS
jgi:hypothetical protein